MRRHFTVLLLSLLILPSIAAGAVRLSEVRQGADWIELVLPSPLPRFTVSALTGPDRMVIDLEGVESGTGTKTIKVDTATVEQVRFGVYPQKLRVVLDLKVPAKTLKVFEQRSGLWIGPPQGPQPPVVLKPRREEPKREVVKPLAPPPEPVAPKQAPPPPKEIRSRTELYPAMDRSRERSLEEFSLGAGVLGNQQHETFGVNMIGWYRFMGVEGRLETGALNQGELRALVRYQMTDEHQFYAGLGYLYLSKEVDVSGSTMEITATSITVPFGYSYRLPLWGGQLSIFAEGLYTPAELKSTLVIGNNKIETVHTYDQLSGVAGLVWYFF